MIDDQFKEIVKNLQKKIDEDEEMKYSKEVISEYRHPTYFGVLDHPDAVGQITGPCGDTMKIALRITDATIRDARFWTDGCGPTIACGNMLIKMIRNKTLQQAAAITNITLLDALGGLPKEHEHCALLAVSTLHQAVENCKYNETMDEKNDKKREGKV